METVAKAILRPQCINNRFLSFVFLVQIDQEGMNRPTVIEVDKLNKYQGGDLYIMLSENMVHFITTISRNMPYFPNNVV